MALLAHPQKNSALDQGPLLPWGPHEISGLLTQLRTDSRPWDVLVIGAGITGAGVARDAAMRGLRVLVIEAKDIAFGTSSRSTRLIHGGVRYLEQGELGLVYEALRERQRLYEIADHLVRPARFLFPAYKGDRLPLWQLRVGLSMYDALSLYRSHGHKTMRAKATLEAEPLLAPQYLCGAVAYEDAITDDARLTLATLQSARRYGAQVLSYTSVKQIHPQSPQGHLAVLEDGSEIRAHTVIVAAGPWTGEKLLGGAGRDLLTLARGVHIVMRHEDVPVRQPLVIQVQKQRRILFVVPWGTRTYIGTTDESYEGDPGESSVYAADKEDLFRLVRRLLPNAKLTIDRIISTWSGVRPLVRAKPSRWRGRNSTVELSRKHRVVINEHNVIAVVGGKLTTYRSMAEEAVDLACQQLVLHHGLVKKPSQTHLHPLILGPILTPEELSDPLIADLAPRHGPEARILAQTGREKPELGERLVDDLPYRWVEVDHAITYEGCQHLDDILRRRLPLALTDSQLGGGVARKIAERLVDAWGGSNQDVEAELERYKQLLYQETGFTLKQV